MLYYNIIGSGCCSRTGGVGQGQLFRESGNEKSRRKSEDGQKFLPPNPLSFCPPERKSFSKFGIGIFPKIRSDFSQEGQLINNQI